MMASLFGSRPTAKAFSAGSSIMYMEGIVSSPEAIFNSSTML